MGDSDAVTTKDSTVDDWTAALAESTGSPGGGAAGGVMLAIAASLMSMVAGYSEPAGDGEDPSRAADLERRIARARALRTSALDLADGDAAASSAFGAAFRLDPGDERREAIRTASVEAARASAAVGGLAVEAVDDVEWLAAHGNPALIADVTVVFGALRAAISAARTNVSFDLASLRSTGEDLARISEEQPALWRAVHEFTHAVERIDAITARLDSRAAPTDDEHAPG